MKARFDKEQAAAAELWFSGEWMLTSCYAYLQEMTDTLPLSGKDTETVVCSLCCQS